MTEKTICKEDDTERLKRWFKTIDQGGTSGVNIDEEYNPSFSFAGNQDKLRRKIQYSTKRKTEKTVNLDKFYEPIYTAVSKICQGYSNVCFIRGRAGLGKSYQIGKAFKQNGIEPVEITGEVTEAYLYRLIYENNGKPIWLRDVVTIMKGLKSLNLLKSATESEDKRVLTKSNYSKVQDDMENSFECTCSFVFDFNNLSSLSKSLRYDIEALFSRGDYVEMMASDDEIKEIMRIICKTPNQNKVTDYLISNFESGGLFRLNLRTQYKAFKTYEYAIANSLNWKDLLNKELTYVSQDRAMLYSLIGKNPVRTADLKKLLMKHGIVQTERTADRKVIDWVFADELFKISNEKKNYYVSLFPKVPG